MTWTKNSSILGTATCTQFQNTAQDQLNPQTLYSTSPFINDNTTQFQTITFDYFKTQTISTVGSVIVMDATTSSGLQISYQSSDTAVASISGSNVTIHSAGVINITASQSGNATYNAAVPIICQLTITLSIQITGPSTYLSIPQTMKASTSKSSIVNISTNINDIRYTHSSGVAYGYATGFRGAVLMGSITATDISSSQVTDFSTHPVTISLYLPNSNTNNTLQIHKYDNGQLIAPQPSGYPVTLTYNSGNNLWTGTMTSLSNIVVLDQNPPSGTAGGDPYIISTKKVKTLLPNTWKKILLFKSDTTQVIANCDFITKNIINNLHYINKKQEEALPINVNHHKWVTDYTYILSIEFINNDDEKLIIDTITGDIIYDSSKFLYEKITDNLVGLFSITHGGYYPARKLQRYSIHLNEGFITISIDNYWDDINDIKLYLHDSTNTTYSGELIEHSESNLITNVDNL